MPSFATVDQERIGALIVAPDALFNVHREQIVTLAAQHAVPAAVLSAASSSPPAV